MTTTSNNTASTTTTPAFQVGLYYGVEASTIGKYLKVFSKIAEMDGTNQDPKWVEMMVAIETGCLEGYLLGKKMEFKNIKLAPHLRDGITFVEIQISKTGVEASLELHEQFSEIIILVGGMLKSLLQVIKISGIMQKFDNFNKVMSEKA